MAPPPPPPPAEPKAIVERAFSYGGLLVRTFHHADAAPALPELPPAPDDPSPWTFERLSPPKRRRGPLKKKQKTGEPTAAPPTPGATSSEGATEREYSTAPQRTPSCATDPSSAWIVNEQIDMPDYVKLLAPEELRAIQIRNRKGRLWIPPEITVSRELEKVRMGGVSAGEADCGSGYRTDYGAADAGMSLGDGGGSEYVHPSPIQLPPLQSSVLLSAGSGYGLPLPALSTKYPDRDVPVARFVAVDPVRPTAASASDQYPPVPPLRTTTPASNTSLPQQGHGQPSPLPITLSPTPIRTTPTPPQDPKRKRDASARPTPHHCDSIPAFLAHITSVIASASAGFIPRPVNVAYTLPIPATEAEYKPFALGLVRDVAAVDRFQWTVAHSQWTTSKTKFTAGARWVCNLSEEGVRDRSRVAGGGGGAAAGRKYARYPCGGSIAVRFSASKAALTFRYTHHAVHSPPRDLRAQAEAERAESSRKLVAVLSEAEKPAAAGGCDGEWGGE